MNNLTNKLSELNDIKFSTISGLNEGEKYFLPSFFAQKVVIIANDEESLSGYMAQLTALNKKAICLNCEIPLIYSLSERQNKVFKNYYITLNKLANNDYDVLLVTPKALIQKLPSIDYIKNNTIKLVKGESYNLIDLSSKLISMGYIKQDNVANKGDFAVRGDILDIFAVNSEKPLRVSFFDDEIEKINYFNPTTFKQENEITKKDIYCFTFFDPSKVQKDAIEEKIKKSLASLKLSSQALIRLTGIVNNQLEYFENGISSLSSVFFLPFCDYFNSSILDFLPQDAQIILDEPKLITDKLKNIEDEITENFLDLSLSGELLPQSINFYLQRKDILKKLINFKLISYARLISQNKIYDSQYNINFICNNVPKYYNHFTLLTQDVNNYIKNKYTVVLSCALPLTLNKAKQFFDEANIKYCEVNSLQEVKPNCVNFLKQNIPYSVNFEIERFVLIGFKSLNSNQVLETTKESDVVQKPKFLPKVGEYVVHQVHGVGKCVGIENLKLTSVYKDYIILLYKDNDKLYLPCENADMLCAYVGEENPKCNKIGGTEFFKVKQKVKSSIKEMAFDLLKVYSARMNSKGFKYSKDTYLQQEFEASFPYPYTVDQVKAIKEIKQDMESSKIMDRLLCGDVGFGKTEVALVAAFKAIQDGKQVAIICPTTILSEQHYNTALTRLKNFMVNVQVINRFKTKKEQDNILNDLQLGKIDLICGTHRLFSSDVKFKDLGLIILDEEQRFGVEDKERLKNMKKTVDVLSLSATPIPRTLYMSLVGIRDVSFLTTPPKERKKINTTVIDYSDALLVNACEKELNRDGQVLIVYNKVESIANFYAHVKSLLPDAKIEFVHGQMSSKMLEQAIYNLYSRKTQVLISTILIENGVDLPYANTLFVIDADKLGLSQLYQLRGRIGRSNIEAFAYFSFSKDKVLTVDSYKRLDAIMEFSDFGSGYKIAMRDLEIRGAGDVLGKLQHGHMQQVGYDMYVKLLNEAVSEIKGEKVFEAKEIKIDIALNAYLPNGYIQSNEDRIDFYTKVSKIKSKQELDDLLQNTQDKYGNLPNPVKQLCLIGFIKNLGQKIEAKQIRLNDFAFNVVFYKDVENTPLFDYLKKPCVDYVLSQENLPIITLHKKSSVEKSQEELIKFLINCSQIKNN